MSIDIFESEMEHHLDDFLLSPADHSNSIVKAIRYHEAHNLNEFLSSLKNRFNYFVNGHGNDINFLSFLMNGENSTYLIEKFEAFTVPEVFNRLFLILENELLRGYHYICIKIIYVYFDKLKWSDQPTITPEDLIYAIKGTLGINNDELKRKILRILVVYLKCSDNCYSEIKNVILSLFENVLIVSRCTISYRTIVRQCDGFFFELVFLLQEKNICTFKQKLIKFVENCKSWFGEFWSYQIRDSLKFLYKIAEDHLLISTKEFIINFLPNTDLTSFVTEFNELSPFYCILDDLSEEEQHKLAVLTDFVENSLIIIDDDVTAYNNCSGFKRLFKNNELTKKLLFGRLDLYSDSLFEKILRKPKLPYTYEDEYVLNYIWTEFQLFTLPCLFTMVSHF